MPALMTSTLPFIAFWFLYMAGLGVIFPYQSLYLHENAALAGTQLGLVLATRPLVGILAQPFWGQLADRTGLRSRTLAILALGTCVAYALFPQAKTFPVLVAAMAFAALFSTSVMPMATSVSMAALGADAAANFGRIRVWGTVGFLVLVVSFPRLLHWAQAARGLVRQPGGSSEPGLELIFYVAAALSLVAAVVAWRAPRSDAMVVRSHRGDLRLLLHHRPYRRLLYVVFLAHLCLQGPILFFPVFVRARGGSIDTVSSMWILMLLIEIPLIFLSGATLRRIGARGLLAVGVFADGFRWLVCSLSYSLPVLYALQLLHGVVVAGLFVGAALYVESVVPARLRSTGQGLLGMVGISCAGMFSSLCAGWLLEHLGPDAAYRIGGAGALLLGVALPFILPRPRRPEASPDSS
jgi:PPP family 3-phenylpropionic acid transporter